MQIARGTTRRTHGDIRIKHRPETMERASPFERGQQAKPKRCDTILIETLPLAFRCQRSASPIASLTDEKKHLRAANVRVTKPSTNVPKR